MNLRQLTILFGALAPSALAQTIALGTQYVDGDPFYDVAWVYGDNPCDGYTAITESNNNPCSVSSWSLDGTSYYLGNCGDNNFALYNAGNNEKISNCVFIETSKTGCDNFEQTYVC